MKKIATISLGLLLVLCLVVFYRAWQGFEDRQLTPAEDLSLDIPMEAAVERFSQSLQFPTVSQDAEPRINATALSDFHRFLAESFPLVHASGNPQTINQHALVFHFPGTDPSLKPILLMGHMDVVPADPVSLDQWTYPPFSGQIADGQIWGRGAIDNKVTVMALMEAMEAMLATNIHLARDVYFAFGHDEEIGGEQGAQAVAGYFQSRDLRFEFVLDEGGVITEGVMPGISEPVATIGIAEKGYLDLRLSVGDSGGHSSQPPDHTAAGILAQALVRLENNQFPARSEFVEATFRDLGVYSGWTQRIVLANLWLLEPLLIPALLRYTNTAASLRTTTAVTMLSGSDKSNVLPTLATATVNFRILPGETPETVMARTRELIDDDRVALEPLLTFEPSQVSPVDSDAYRLIARSIRTIRPETLVTPYLVQGGTDSRFFYPVSDQVYRFIMIRLTPDTMGTFHGIDERISITDYESAIRFYQQLLLSQ
jgi:carboxypeptidase PM20D1